MHPLHRHPRPEGRTKARGFTLLELAVALSAFALIAGVVTLTMARTQLVNAGARLEKAARAELNALLATAGTSPYDQLATDTFQRPQPCASKPEESCVSVLGRTFEVKWTVTAGADLLQASTQNPAAVTVSAEMTLPGSLGTVNVSRTIASPNGGKDGSSGIVRVRLEGAAYTGPIYLVDSQGDTVASGQIRDKIASMRADASLCPASSPCKLALGQQGQSAAATVTMNASSVTGDDADIVLTADAVVEAGAVLLPVTQVSVGLFAVNSDGRRGQPTQTSSVCLHLVFNDGAQQRAVPGCNSSDPTTITWDTYTDSNGNELALPQGVPMTLTTDTPSGTCTSIGQNGYQNGAWIPSSVCTSWTWGPIAGLSQGAAANAPVLSTSLMPIIAPESGTAYYRAVWTAPTGQPAAGLTGQGLWESPRDIPACAATNSCSPVTTSIETNECPGQQCNSTAGIAPQLASPISSGSWKYPSMQVAINSRTAISLLVTDPDQDTLNSADRITASIVSAPAGLERQTATLPTPQYSPVTSGDTIGANLTSGSTVTLYYFGAAAIPPNTTMSVALTDGNGNTSITAIALWSELTPYHVTAYPVTVAQGGSNDMLLTVLDQSGNPAAGAAIAVTGPEGTNALPVESEEAGQFRASINVTDLERGSHQLAVNLPNNRQVNVPLTVEPRLGALAVTLAASQVTQSSTVNAQIQAVDRAGDALNNVDAFIAALSDNEPALGVYSPSQACRTATNGTCTVEITVEPKAPQGNVSVRAQSQGIASPDVTLTIAGVASTITGNPASVPQGTSEQNPVIAVVTIVDGDGQPRSGLNLDLGQRPSGLRAEALGPSDNNGQVRIALSALPGAQAGPPALLPLSAAGAAGGLLVTIEPTTGTLALVPALTLAQGGTVSAVVTAKDAQGQPMPNVTLTVVTTQPVDGPLSLRTGPDGTATLRISVPVEAPRGTYPMTVTTGALQATSNVFVSQGVNQIIVIGNIERGQRSDVTLVLRDSANAPVGGREITVIPREYPAVSFDNNVDSLTAVSNGDGKVTFALNTTAELTKGVTVLDVRVDGRSMSVGVVAQ